ncbi:MAG: hypothetical protein ACYTKD_29340, partial [Planctomycetota bacterium]
TSLTDPAARAFGSAAGGWGPIRNRAAGHSRLVTGLHIKGRFGSRLAFHGCISTAGPVATGRPDDTVRNVRETLEVMMPGGGYCLAPTHSLQDNSPTENVVAMYVAAREFGRY